MCEILVLTLANCCVFAVQGLNDTLGGAQENQRVVLVLGGHVALHQHHPAVAARRAQ